MFRLVIERIDYISTRLIILTMGGMTSIVAIQVLFRYAFNYSIDSADELSRLFFVWSMFLAIPHGVKIGIHVGIDLFIRRLNKHLLEQLFRVTNIISAALMGVVFVIGCQATIDKWPELMPTLPISSGLYYVAVVICAGHSFFHLIYLAWHGTSAWNKEAK